MDFPCIKDHSYRRIVFLGFTYKNSMLSGEFKPTIIKSFPYENLIFFLQVFGILWLLRFLISFLKAIYLRSRILMGRILCSFLQFPFPPWSGPRHHMAQALFTMKSIPRTPPIFHLLKADSGLLRFPVVKSEPLCLLWLRGPRSLGLKTACGRDTSKRQKQNLYPFTVSWRGVFS